MTPINPNTLVSRVLYGYFFHEDYREPIKLEYRYTFPAGFEIHTTIKGKIYGGGYGKFFTSLSDDILDFLPQNSAIMLIHKVPVLDYASNTMEFIELEEWLRPYTAKGSQYYQLKINWHGETFETESSFSFGGCYGETHCGAIEQLRRLTENRFQIQICYFCKNLIEYNEYGGTDYRHDQLYCFRDDAAALERIMKVYPHLKGSEGVLERTVPDMDAFHSCSGFEYRSTPIMD